jgi:hypothetical protein
MKKTISLLLALVLCLSLCACGGGSDAPATKAPEKSSELNVGDTATGQLFDITIQSVEPIEKIENGYVWHMWSPEEKTTYQDITAEEGYTIFKIVYSYKYTGKESGEFCFELSLDYDNGYTFDGLGGHALPAIDNSTTKLGFEESYEIGAWDCFIYIDDPLSFEGREIVEYIIVNDQVLSNTDKAFVLKIDVPTSPWDYEMNEWGFEDLVAQSEPETFIYNLK